MIYFIITTCINNKIGNKYIKWENDLKVVTMTGNKIVSAIDARVFRQHEIPSREIIMIGVHSGSVSNC